MTTKSPRHSSHLFLRFSSDEDYRFVYGLLRYVLERRAGLRLFLAEREVLPGHLIAEGIVEGVQASWRSVFLLTEAFLGDEWGDFKTAMALRSLAREVPDRLLLLLADNLSPARIPEMLLNVVSEEDIFSVDGVDETSEVWRRLVQRIRGDVPVF